MLEINNSEKCQVLNSKMLVSQVFGRTCRLIPTKRTEGDPKVKDFKGHSFYI